jgi:hypothetical protein
MEDGGRYGAQSVYGNICPSRSGNENDLGNVTMVL